SSLVRIERVRTSALKNKGFLGYERIRILEISSSVAPRSTAILSFLRLRYRFWRQTVYLLQEEKDMKQFLSLRILRYRQSIRFLRTRKTLPCQNASVATAT